MIDIYLMSDEEEECVESLQMVVFPRQRRLIRDRPNHLEEWRDFEFFDRFRLSKATVLFICDQIRDKVASKTTRNAAVTVEQMLLITLRYFATGSFVSVCGDFGGVHKSTASRIIRKVARALAGLHENFISFPCQEDAVSNVRNGFYLISKFPKCIGAIDCTHIKIKSPGGEEAESYRNRKGFFSFNVQTICDSALRIQNIVARWPGSTHDATIFKNSKVRESFEKGEHRDSVLVGDSDYALRPFLLTKFAVPSTRGENLYNEALIRTRNVVERSYGVWKRRFPVLANGINLHISNVEAIVVATAVLHNIACEMNEKEPPCSVQLAELVANTTFNQGQAHTQTKNMIRTPFVSYFDSLVE